MARLLEPRVLEPRLLEPHGARRLLRHHIWRRGWLYLLPALVLAGLCVSGMSLGVLRLSYTDYDGARPMDGTLCLGLFMIAFAIAIAVARIAPRLGALLPRLPVDPVAMLHARLQLATALGVLVFGCLLLTEYLAAPVMMHPSFTGRLNPAETETLKRLPGVPLLRFTVDGEVTKGLASELSVAAIRPVRGSGSRISGYGETFRWSHFRYDPPEPGEVLAALGLEDWPRLDDFERRLLRRRLGVPTGAAVEIVLERYVSRAEYLARPWRRDGLGRERRWHALDRAVGFLGLLILLTCAMSAQRQSISVTMVAPMSLLVFQWSAIGRLPFRSGLLFSDLTAGRPKIPSFGTQQTVLENWVWPVVVVAACAAVYAVVARQVRSEPLVHTQKGDSFADYLRRQWRSGLPGRVELIAVVLFFGVCFGSFGVALWPDARALHGMAWMFAVLAVAGAVVWMTGRWARRDALLSRLPVPPARVAWRRLAWAVVAVVGIALVPLLIEHAAPLADPVGSDPDLLLFSGSCGWAKSLLITASGYLIMIFALFGRSKLGSRLGAVLCLSIGVVAMSMLGFRQMPWLTWLSLGAVAAALPLIHRLMRRRVELGRAPEVSEL